MYTLSFKRQLKYSRRYRIGLNTYADCDTEFILALANFVHKSLFKAPIKLEKLHTIYTTVEPRLIRSPNGHKNLAVLTG